MIVLLITGLGLWFVNWTLAASSSLAPQATICTVDDDSPADYATIQGAVDDLGCDAIYVAAGTYTESVVISRSVKIWGAGIYDTVVDGEFSHRVFMIGNAGASVSLARMSIRFGDAGDDDYGGGIYNKGRLALYDVSVIYNDADYGGGIYNTGMLTLTDSLVDSNYADTSGGGIHSYLSGHDFYQGLWVTTTIINSRITNNDVWLGDGAGIFSMGTLTITGSEIGDNACVGLSGGTGGGIRVHWTSGPVTIEDSVIHDNYADYAGGILAEVPVTIRDSQILTNTARNYGGGIDISDGLTLTNSTVSGNTAGLGGGILVNNQFTGTWLLMSGTDVTNNTPGGIDVSVLGTYHNPVDIEIYSSVISNNNGDGINADAGPDTLLIRNSQINDNAGDGIDLKGFDDYDHGTLTLIQSFVSNNTGRGIDGHDVTVRYSRIHNNGGGGISVKGHLKLNFSSVSGNTSGYRGGGVYGYEGQSAESGAIVEVRGSTISGNSAATDGGGICIDDNSQLTLNNSTVSGNTAGENGGGVAVVGSAATASLDHATVTYNTADQDGDDTGDGGGIYRVSSSGAVSVARSIVATNDDNSPTGSDHPDCSGDFVASGMNLIGVFDNSGCQGLGGALQQTGTPADPLDPMLSPLADNGGPTLTHAPDPTSPAVDWEFSTSCPLDVDQRGVDRPQGDSDGDLLLECDFGAYEIGTAPAPVVPTLSIARNDNDLKLSWTDNPANRMYEIWRATDPFDPGTAIAISDFSNNRTDYGIIGDPGTNYFYGVRAENATGDTSAISNLVGEFDFGVKPGKTRLRLTMVALPLEGAHLPATADDVAAHIDPAGSVKVVARWRPQTQSWQVRRVGSPFGTPSFPVSPGDTLFIGADSTAPESFAWVGDVPTAGSIQHTLYPNAGNFILVPLDQSGQFTPTATGLAADIGGVTRVVMWSYNAQTWIVRSAGTGVNFPVRPGYPYGILTDNSAPPSWP